VTEGPEEQDPRWTVETEEITAQAIYQSTPHAEDNVWHHLSPDGEARWYMRERAKVVLDALHGIGLLLPPGGSSYIEYGYVRRDIGSSYSSHDPVDAAQAFARAGGVAVARRGTRVAIEGPETGGLYYGPWQFDDE
jgi:hypothetical protein